MGRMALPEKPLFSDFWTDGVSNLPGSVLTLVTVSMLGGATRAPRSEFDAVEICDNKLFMPLRSTGATSPTGAAGTMRWPVWADEGWVEEA